MNLSQRVLNRSVGHLDSRIMFIGEAPGRLGAESSGIPFHGDKAGHNFEDLLRFAGISREEVYVTNAVLCNPRDEHGNNATPNNQEISNCSKHLQRQIELINPLIIVTLGAKALQALDNIEKHALTLKDTRTSNNWLNKILIPVYHPGQRAMLHRSLANQRSDYQFIADQFRKIENGASNKKTYGSTPNNISLIIEYILSKKNPISYFALHKLFYLVEYHSFVETGQKLTTSYFVRQKDGPYCTDLHPQRLKKSITNLQIRHLKNGSLIIQKESTGLFDTTLMDEFEMDSQTYKLIDEVLAKYGSQGMSKLKQSVYMTRPMRNILFLEKNEKINLCNSPINFITKPLHLEHV